MSSRRFEAPLRIRPERSRLLAALLTVVHLTALAMLPMLAVSQTLKIAAGAAVLVCFYRAIRAHALLLGERAIRELVWEPSGEILIVDGMGHARPAAVSPDCFAHPFAIVLNLRLQDSARRALVLLPDSAPAHALRQLRMRLRMTASADQIES